MTPEAHAPDQAPVAPPFVTGGASAGRAPARPAAPRPGLAPPSALVPPPVDPAVHAERVRAALLALERVRVQLQRTQRSLDAFVTQITHIPAPVRTGAPVAPPVAAPVLPPAPLDQATGTPSALAGHVLAPAAGPVGPVGYAVPTQAPAAASPAAPVAVPARRRAAIPASEVPAFATVTAPAPDPAPAHRLGRPRGPARRPVASAESAAPPPGLLSAFVLPAAPAASARLDDA